MNAKRESRRQALDALKSASFPSAEQAAETICRRIDYSTSEDVLAFYPLRNEIDVTGVIDRALADGKRVWLPVCVDDRNMKFARVAGAQWRDCLCRTGNGTLCPETPEWAETDSLGRALILVPGLAFDGSNHRLGRGGGYYDVFLASIKGDSRFKTLGVCLGCQLRIGFPIEEQDQAVDEVLAF